MLIILYTYNLILTPTRQENAGFSLYFNNIWDFTRETKIIALKLPFV